jgi:hypothetical protein
MAKSKIDEGVLDSIRKYIVDRLDKKMDKKIEALLNSSPRDKKAAVELAAQLKKVEKMYKAL